MENYENIKVNFDSFIQSLKSNADDIEFRKKSFNHFLTNGFPKAKDEQWKYFNNAIRYYHSAVGVLLLNRIERLHSSYWLYCIGHGSVLVVGHG